MKKLWLFLSLLICSTLVAGCNFKSDKIMDWDWMVNEVNEPLIDEPESVENKVEPIKNLEAIDESLEDDSWIKVAQKKCIEQWWEEKHWKYDWEDFYVCRYKYDTMCFYEELYEWRCKKWYDWDMIEMYSSIYDEAVEDTILYWDASLGKRDDFDRSDYIPIFWDILNFVTTCHVDDMWWYDYEVYEKAYILPYKDWFIWYELWWQDWRQLKLTYRTLDDPCNIISTTDEIFWWDWYYGINQSRILNWEKPDNKIYIAQWLWSWVPTEEIVRELDCEDNKYSSMSTCSREPERYVYNLIMWNEKNEYFTKRMNKFKEDIDNGNYTTPDFWLKRYDSCLQSVRAEIWEVKPTDSEKIRQNYQKLQVEKMHECAVKYLDD